MKGGEVDGGGLVMASNSGKSRKDGGRRTVVVFVNMDSIVLIVVTFRGGGGKLERGEGDGKGGRERRGRDSNKIFNMFYSFAPRESTRFTPAASSTNID